MSRTSREENNRKRQRGCAQTACECTVRIQYLAKGVYKVQEKGFTHNHEPSQDASAHPSNRRLTVDGQKNIDRLTITGVKVWQIKQLHKLHIVPAHGALANLVDAMEVETTHRLVIGQ